MRRAFTLHLHLACSAVLVSAVLASAPGAAHAGLYVVDSCRHADGTPASTDGWAASGTLAAADTLEDSCAQGGALTLSMVEAGGGADAHAGAPMGIVFRTRDANLVPRGAEFWSWAALPNAGPGATWSTMAMAGDWAYGSGEILRQVSGPAIVGNPLVPLAAANRIVAPGTVLGPGAALSTWLNCSSGSFTCPKDATVALTRAALTIEDVAAPRLLSEPTVRSSSAPLSGVVQIAVQATDAGSGLYRAGLRVDDGAPVLGPFDAADPRCSAHPGTERTFDRRQPCAVEGAAELTWDSTGSIDGEHRLQVVVEDASGNRVTSSAVTVITHNAAPVIPTPAPVVRGGQNGAGADDRAQLTLAWPATAVPASTRPRDVRRCARPSYRKKQPLRCTGRAAQASLERSFSAKATDVLAGRLVASSGQPIAGARVEIAHQAAVAGAVERAWGAATTRSDGTFTAELPRGEGSATFVVRYRSHVGDPAAAAEAHATRRVAGATSLVTPRRVAPGTRISFHGTLLGRSGRLDGVPVALQVRIGGRWRTFATTQTRADGAWTEPFRFASVPGRYAVRAQLGTSLGYPYAAGGSATMTVRVG